MIKLKHSRKKFHSWMTCFGLMIYPSWMNNDTLPTCAMGCAVSSIISTNFGVVKLLTSLNYFLWLIMWFEVQKNHILNIDTLFKTFHVIEFCHMLHHKELFITLVTCWCIVAFLQHPNPHWCSLCWKQFIMCLGFLQ